MPAGTPDAIAAYLAAQQDQAGGAPDRALTKAAVKAVSAELERRAPGRSVELRVPPYVAVQLVAGTAHRRGTPPALVQLAAPELIALAVGSLRWDDALADGLIRASGERSDLGWLFPLY